MTTMRTPVGTGNRRLARPMRHVGYGAALLVNLVLIWVVSNLMAWGILPFLTEDFALLEPIVLLSLWLSVALNAGYLFYDPEWFRLTGDTLSAGVAFVVVFRTYQIFPFEFPAGFWNGGVRVLLIIVGVAVAVGTLANAIKLLTGRVWDQADAG